MGPPRSCWREARQDLSGAVREAEPSARWLETKLETELDTELETESEWSGVA